jgi:hypothetical protein
MKTKDDKIEEFKNRIIDVCREYEDVQSDEMAKMVIKWTIRAAVNYGQRIGASNKINGENNHEK